MLEFLRPSEPSYPLLGRTLREQIRADWFGDDEPLPTELASPRIMG